MISQAPVGLNCNVIVTVKNRDGQVVQRSMMHNKATMYLVDGLLRFLKGDFNKSSTNLEPEETSWSEAQVYLPNRISYGNVGVLDFSRSFVNELGEPIPEFNGIAPDRFLYPTFNSYRLQDEIPDPSDRTVISPAKVSTVVLSDANNSEGLRIFVEIPAGSLVGRWIERPDPDNPGEFLDPKFTPYDYAMYNPLTQEYETIITELGLFSNTGAMLARVLFDGQVDVTKYYQESSSIVAGQYASFANPNDPSNPIIQSQSTAVVVEWQIDIVSIGADDHLITDTDIGLNEFAIRLSQDINDKIEAGETVDTQYIYNHSYEILDALGIHNTTNIG